MSERAASKAELEILAAENHELRQRVDSLVFMLRHLSLLPPLDSSRQAICAAVDEWVRERHGGDATTFEIAQAVLQAAVASGWVLPPEDQRKPEQISETIARLTRIAELQEQRMLAYLLDVAKIEAQRIEGPS